MKTLQFILFLLFVSISTFAQEQFQGIITMKVNSPQTVTSSSIIDGEKVISQSETKAFNTNMTIYIQGNVTVLDMPADGGQLRVMMDYITGDVTYITAINGNRSIKNANINDSPNLKTDENPSTATFKATGESKMISGYQCLEYEVKSEDGSGTIWVAPDLKHININERMLILKMEHNENIDFLQFYDGVEGFVMEMRGKDKDGNLFELDVAVQEKKLQDALFQMPKVSKEQQKEMDKRAKMMEISQEYRKKMMEHKDNPEKIKELGLEMSKKLKELQEN